MSQIDEAQAFQLAQARINQLAVASNDRFVIISDYTEEINEGWVFFYNSEDFVRSGNLSDALAGNGPILVTRQGVIYELPAAIPWQKAVEELRLQEIETSPEES
ncbi:MAG: YrhB domain-containing protein [Nitrospira sp.]